MAHKQPLANADTVASSEPALPSLRTTLCESMECQRARHASKRKQATAQTARRASDQNSKTFWCGEEAMGIACCDYG
eukprot:4132771-Amphidinium_carterae.2